MTKLSVNINKIATLRNARGGNTPDLIQAARDIESFGADGITVHPRPDERHIRYADVYALKKVVTTEFNIEGYPSEEFIKLIADIRPEQVTLVPDPPGVLTSNAGWDTVHHQAFLAEVAGRLKSFGCRVSLFTDPDETIIAAAQTTGTDRIELYTESYAVRYAENPVLALAPYIRAAVKAKELGLGVNAGHDLNLQNLRYFQQHIPQLLEVSIGHALISDALYMGLKETIRLYKEELRAV